MNTGNPSPMMTPPPPTPPAKGGFPWKWVLIGCGSLTLLGVLTCGGCSLFVYFSLKKALAEGIAQVKPLIENNETVKAKVGKIDSIDPDFTTFSSEQKGSRTVLHFSLKVTGDKGKGTLVAKLLQTRGDPNNAVAVLKFRDEAGTLTPIGIWKGQRDQWTPLPKEPAEDE